MTQKERRTVYELVAIGMSGLGLALTAPVLVSEHDSVALLAAVLLIMAWVGWVAFFLYRISKGELR